LCKRKRSCREGGKKERRRMVINVLQSYGGEGVLIEYIRFMQLKKKLKDFNATLLSPSLQVDRVWHNHILDTRNYGKDCRKFVGRLIHHNPDGALNSQERARRFARTILEYKLEFEQELPNEHWSGDEKEEGEDLSPLELFEKNRVGVFVKDSTGKHVVTLPVEKGEIPVQDVFQHLVKMGALKNIDHGRLICRGMQLFPYDSVKEGNVVYLVHRLKGC
jgi:hypothetical protein